MLWMMTLKDHHHTQVMTPYLFPGTEIAFRSRRWQRSREFHASVAERGERRVESWQRYRETVRMAEIIGEKFAVTAARYASTALACKR